MTVGVFPPDFTQSTWDFYLFTKSSESSKGSLWFTVVSFFPLSYTRSKSRNSQGGKGFPGSKAKDVEFWSNLRRDFFGSFSAGNKANTQTTARLLLIFHRPLNKGCTGGNLARCYIAPAFLFSCISHGESAPIGNKNSCNHEGEWGQAEQTCLRIEICFELSHDQALAHSCLLLRFLSTGGTTAEPLWFLCMWNYFPPLPTQAPHGARACNSAWCFDSSPSRAL